MGLYNRSATGISIATVDDMSTRLFITTYTSLLDVELFQASRLNTVAGELQPARCPLGVVGI